MDLKSANIPGSMSGTADARLQAHVGPLETPIARALLVVGFALMTWVAAKVSVPLPMTPVPGTLQTLAVLLAGAVLGARAGAVSQASYIFMGMAGLPVFALPGSGPLYLLGPTGGYLVGFIAAAFVVGSVIKRTGGRGVLPAALAFLLGAATIHACGLAWLSVVLGDPAAAFRAGVLPFVLFDLAKVVVATGIHAGYLRWKPATES
jgi:biotin transport system substrate-specific component